MTLLPDIRSDEELLAIHRDPTPWLAATHEVAARHGVASDEWSRAGDGSQIVMLGSGHVVKFYVPFWPSVIDTETAAMELVHQVVSNVATPAVIGRGVLDGWEYLVLTRIEGVPLREIRGELTESESVALMEALGATLARLHEVTVPPDSTIRAVVPDWREFLSVHHARREELELQRDTSAEWTAKLSSYLADWEYTDRATETLLHADLTDSHVFVAPDETGSWRLSGLVDFGDAKIGDAAYEFAAPFAFWTAGRPTLRAAMLRGYGPAPSESFLRRIFESLLLHEFGRLALLDLEGISSIEQIYERYIDVRSI